MAAPQCRLVQNKELPNTIQLLAEGPVGFDVIQVADITGVN